MKLTTREQLLAVLALAFVLTSCGQVAKPPAPTIKVDAGAFAQFEAELEDLRHKLKIPAFSAAIVENQALVWAK